MSNAPVPPPPPPGPYPSSPYGGGYGGPYGAPPPSGPARFCPQCGTPVVPFTYACTRCGAALPKATFPGQKSKLAAGLLGIFLGAFGVHRFYLGYVGIGVAQIAVTIVTCGIGAIWGFIEGILILTGSGITTDAEGRPLGD